ncbi:MAG: hypothetical protein Q4C73_09115 [Eubacteriales bacterium]|nr:hypothetical protein [Eubacteriales bacterium]
MAAAAAVLFFSGLAFCGQAMAQAEAALEVKLDIQYGYDNMAKGGRYLPLDVSIQSGGGKALSAVLRVKSVESDGTIYCYEYPVQTTEGEQASSRYYIPLGTGADRLAVTLEDGSGNVLAEESVKLNVSRDVPEMYIGILSDEPEKLSWLNGAGISYSTLRTRTFELDEADFPEEEVGLSLLDVLVVNNYKLRSLSELQTGAIMDWVHHGGVLILGTGERVDDTLGRFAPELLDNSYGAAALRHINLAENYILEEPGAGMFAISCVDISLHGGNVIISSDDFPLLTAAVKEQGLIAVAAFDLGEIDSFCQQNTGYIDYLFTGLLGEDRINRLAEAAYSGNSGKFWSVQTLINTGNLDKLPKLAWYVAVVAVYLALLGPALYLFLKNRDLQIYYRRGVVVLSLFFAALIYVMGGLTRFRSTFFTYATIQDTTSDYVADTTYVNIRNPYNRPYTVELNPDYTVLPITRTTRAGYTASESLDGPYQIAIGRTEDQVTVRGQNIPAFTPRYFQLEKKTENTDRVGVTGEVDYFEGRISGSLTNGFPFPIENTTVILYGNMVQIGRMEAGETKKLEDFALLRFPLGNSYVVADWVSGESAFHTIDIKNQDYLLAMERSNLLRFYLDNYMTGYTADARVIAFSTQKEESQFLKHASEESYGMTMLTSSVDVNASRDRSLYRSVLMKMPNVISGSYDSAGNSMSGMEPLTLEYRLGTDIDVESLTFESVNEIFLEADGNSFTEAFTGSIYFYNYGTGNYDLMELEGQTLDVGQLRPYLSPENTLTVRYVYDGTSIYNAIQLPMPMVAGRER